MSDTNCLEYILREVVKVDFIPTTTCHIPIPCNVPCVYALPTASVTLGEPKLTVQMAVFSDADTTKARMLTAPTWQQKDSFSAAGKVSEHTFTLTVDRNKDNVRRAVAELTGYDVYVVLTYMDGSRAIFLTLPNTTQITIDDQLSATSSDMSLKAVVKSLNGLVKLT